MYHFKSLLICCTHQWQAVSVSVLNGGHYSTECRMLNAIYYFTELSAEYALWRSTIQ
jgi:putative NIF3 family GTP cyclohydrolase 1 type 2